MFSVFGITAFDLFFLLLHFGDPGSFPKPLSKEEEKKYLSEMKAGDDNARKTLIERNLRLVAHIIKKYYAGYKAPDDLISIGTIGLIKGIDSFSAEKGTHLATYVSRCIENEILMYFRNRKKLALEISLEEPIDTDDSGNTLTVMDTVKCDDNIFENTDKKIKIEKLSKLINNKLSERERKIMILRYGLSGDAPKTQRETAKILGISRSYVSRIEKKVLSELKMYLS